MIYKINADKRQEFEKWNFRQTLKRQLPFFIPFFIILDIIMLILFPMKYQTVAHLIPTIVLVGNLIFIPLYIASLFSGARNATKNIDDWELEINDGHAILRNSLSTTSVHFADFRKCKKGNDSICFYLKGTKFFSINWNCFLDSEKLKSELEQVAEKIGTSKKEELSSEAKKTMVKFTSRFVVLIIGAVLIIALKFLFYKL